MAELEPSEILAAHTLTTAAETMKTQSVGESNELLKKVAELYARNGRFRSAAKCYQKIAESYNNTVEFKLAIDAYLKSAEYEALENEESQIGAQAVQSAADLIISYDTEKLADAIPVNFPQASSCTTGSTSATSRLNPSSQSQRGLC